jgi:hypothetical protein
MVPGQFIGWISLCAAIAVLGVDSTPMEAPPSTTGADPALPPEPVEELWIGHQVAIGRRAVPLLGELETRIEYFLLARARRSGSELTLEQWPCAVRIKPVLGIQVRMPPATMAKMPQARIEFSLAPDMTTWSAQPWEVGWGVEDLDGDGQPGMTVQVESFFCTGRISTSTWARSTASARDVDGALAGEIAIETREDLLGASQGCLLMGGRHREERQTGRFRYRRADPGTSCEQLSVEAWPVDAGAALNGPKTP